MIIPIYPSIYRSIDLPMYPSICHSKQTIHLSFSKHPKCFNRNNMECFTSRKYLTQKTQTSQDKA